MPVNPLMGVNGTFQDGFPVIPGEPVPATPTAKLSRPAHIFSAGVFQGFDYTPAFLREAVANFKRYQSVEDPIGFPKVPGVLVDTDDLRAPGIAIGHEDVHAAQMRELGDEGRAMLAEALMRRTDQPASAWVSDLFMVGNAVFAMLDGLPIELAADMNAGKIRYCSAEWYRDYVGASGTHYGPMLRRVAILGGELPRLKFLGRLPPAVFSEGASWGSSSILCFSEGRSMSHDELVMALAAFMPNIAAVIEALGLSDDQLQTLLKLYQTPAEGSTGTETPVPDPAATIATNAEGTTVTPPPAAAVMTNSERGKAQPNYVAVFSEMVALLPQLKTALAVTNQQNKAQAAAIKIVTTEAKNKELADVEAWSDRMVKEGKLTPFEAGKLDSNGKPKASFAEQLLGMDSVNKVYAFGDSHVSLREMQMKQIEARGRNRVFTNSERMPAEGKAADGEAKRVAALATTPRGLKALEIEARAAGKTVTADGRPVPRA